MLLARLAEPFRPIINYTTKKENQISGTHSGPCKHTHQTDANLYLGRLLYSIRGTAQYVYKAAGFINLELDLYKKIMQSVIHCCSLVEQI